MGVCWALGLAESQLSGNHVKTSVVYISYMSQRFHMSSLLPTPVTAQITATDGPIIICKTCSKNI